MARKTWLAAPILAAMVLVAGGLSGCRQGSAPVAAPPMTPPDVPTVNGIPMHPAGQINPAQARQYVMTVRLTVFRVELPLGAASRSERLWRYFDEELADAAVITVLHRNGFRLGRSRVEDWPAVSRVLEKLAGAAPAGSRSLALPGRQEHVVLRERMGFQRLFVFDRQGLLSGQDYPPGDNVLVVTCHINGQDPTEVIFQAVPAVLTEKQVLRWEQSPEGPLRRQRRVELPVAELEFTVRAPRGTYLVIGPGADVMRTTSAAHGFLLSEQAGQRRETLLVLVPEVFAAPA